MSQEIKNLYRFGPFGLDAEKRQLFRGGQPVPLTARALATRLVLVKKRGQVVEKDDLMNEVWGDTVVEEGNLTFYIHRIRKALGEWENGERYVETIPGRGYRFVAPVEVGDGSALPQAVPEPAVPVVTPVQVVGAVREPPLRWFWFALAGAGALLVIAVVARLLSTPLPPPRIRGQRQLTYRSAVRSDHQMVTDGRSLYFTEEGTGRNAVLASVSTQGGEPRATPVPFQMLPQDISIARQELLAVGSRPGQAYGTLWALPLPNGPPRRIGDLQAGSAAWSPDGRQIAYAKNYDIYLAQADGSNSRELASLSSVRTVSWLRWSPDGKLLRFTVEYEFDEAHLSKRALWEIGADGRNLHRLPYDQKAPNPCCGSWTPDGKYFIFQSSAGAISGDQANDKADIWAVREKADIFGRAPSPVLLTSGPLTSYSSPTPSPDGRELFVVGQGKRGELSDWDRNRKEFVPYLQGIPALWVSFSRDGQSVAYVKHPEGTLWRAGVDLTSEAAPYVTRPKQLTFAPMQVVGLAWSPDGKQIAFRAIKPGKPFKIYLVSAESGEIHEMLPEDPNEEGIPSWSADGTQIAFGEVAPALFDATGNEVIHLYNLATHERSILPGSKGLWTARWSPDGRYIAAAEIQGYRRLKLFDFQSGRSGSWRDLHVPQVSMNLTWSRDSRYLYFDRGDHGPDSGVFRVRVPDGAAERVADFDQVILQRIDAWSGLALDDSPLILRDIGTQEIYALDVEWP